MPLIEEISDDEQIPQAETLSDEQIASRTLETCLLIRNGQLPLETKYETILSTVGPLERYLSSTPPPEITKIQSGILQLLLPHSRLASELTSFDPEDAEVRIRKALQHFHRLSESLLSLISKATLTPDLDLAITLVSFTSLSDPWTSPATLRLAASLLECYSAALTAPELLINSILNTTLKPLFTTPTATTSHLTPAARLSIRPIHPSSDISTPPWLENLPSTPTLLSFTLSHLPTSHLDEAWPLLVPPILTITDSTSTRIRTRGILLIHQLLDILSAANSTLLTRSGLAPLLWDTLVPGFSYLPTLTPAPESAELLSATFPCLRALANHREPVDNVKRAKLLDVLMRDGVAHGLTFAAEHPAVVKVLCREARATVEEMGVYAVRHLRALTRAMSDILANPLGNADPEVLEEACGVLETVVGVCWMRVGVYVAEVMRGTGVCWRRVNEDESDGRGEGLEGVKRGLKRVVGMLGAVVRGEDEARWEALRAGMVEVDPGFLGLFEEDVGVENGDDGVQRK